MASYEYVALWMWIFIASGGVAVWLMYRFDGFVNWLLKIRNDKEINDLVSKQNNDGKPTRQ